MRSLDFCCGLLLILSGCAISPVTERTHPVESINGLLKITNQSWEKLSVLNCTRGLVEGLRLKIDSNVDAAVQSAYCYNRLIETEANSSQRLADAKQGLHIAENLVQQNQDNALAHYLHALLTGHVADNDALHGLSLVPAIEQAAKAAAKIDPAIDEAGPERMLGELYLRAPGAPVSLGDTEAAARHFKHAVTLAPKSIDNQLGLVEALLASDELDAGCRELHILFSKFPPPTEYKSTWVKGLKLLSRLCKLQE
jgi:tetratricopeptide (TPR) repeat protein